jgi:hypothetical protein
MSKARDLANAGTALGAVSATELGYVDGVTSAIQTQIDGKQAVNANVSTTELGYLDGVTSAIQTQLDAKTAKSTLTTKGDVYAATAASTPARLGVGANGTVLTADSAEATGLKWATPAAGAFTSLATGNIASTGNTTITSFSTAYRDLVLEIKDYVNATDDLGMRFNSDSGSTSYGYSTIGGGTTVSNLDSTSRFLAIGFSSTGSKNNSRWLIANYNETKRKIINYQVSMDDPNRREFGTASWKNNAAITTITLFPISGTVSGGTYTLYGVN